MGRAWLQPGPGGADLPHGLPSHRISNIHMDVAVPHSTGLEQALEVEECTCPTGYRGPSCQVSGHCLPFPHQTYWGGGAELSVTLAWLELQLTSPSGSPFSPRCNGSARVLLGQSAPRCWRQQDARSSPALTPLPWRTLA